MGLELAQALCDAAKRTVGRHHGTPYELQMRYACEDITTLRARIKSSTTTSRRPSIDTRWASC
ncbi:MAG: hypothetical protein H6720_02085 [Sandaracinus sp.]|nr:hypothetical protein [Sandaracinus sp.]